MSAHLEVSNLSCRRGGRQVYKAVSFELGPGDALILRGANGSGKSTLLRQLAGLLPAAPGSIVWRGEDIGDDPVRHGRRISYLGHADALKPTFTVKENIVFWAVIAGAGEDGATAALAQLNLDNLAAAPVRLLSAGQRRRAALASILASPAPVWLLDEPTVALDSAAVRALHEAIRAKLTGGGMIVLASHDPLDLPGASTFELDSKTRGS